MKSIRLLFVPRNLFWSLAKLTAALALLGARAAHADYPSLILSDNPVAYYRLEELPGATTAVDSSPNHFDATYVYDLDTNGVPDYPQLGRPGIATNSVYFHLYTDSGSVVHNGSITIPFQPQLSPVAADGQHGAACTFECWAQANTQPGDYSIPLSMFGKYETGAYVNASGWNFYQSPGPSSVWILNFKNGGFIQSATPITLLQWYHLAGAFDGTNVTFYINGAPVGGPVAASGYLADHNFDGQIGAGDNTGFKPFDGSVDEVAFYTNALSPAQILAHYASGTNSFRAPPTPPGIVQSPVSSTNFAGTTVTFTALASGTAPLSYQWFKGTAAVASATNLNYSFICGPADNGAAFSIKVTNALGSTNSAAATLTVLTNLNLLYQPFSITRRAGSKAAFRVAANGAVPIQYQWSKTVNGVASVIPGATNDTLWLSNIKLTDDQSTYTAHVSGPYASADTTPTTLTVQARAVTVPLTGYAKVVVADDPVAYLRLDESTGATIATDAVGSFDGAYDTTIGELTFGVATGIPHETDPAINITQGAIVSIPYALELNPVTGPWSAEAWVKPATLDPNHFRTVFSSLYNSDFGGHLYGWNVYQHVAGVWTMNMFSGGAGGSFNSGSTPIIANTWYHMVIADDLTTIRFFVNGVQITSLSRNGFGFIPNGINGDPSVAGSPTVLGQRADLAFDPFDGSFDDVAFYNYALSADQIQNHFLNATKLSVTQSGGQIILSWPQGTLQSASVVTGPFTTVTGATSPLTNSVAGSAQKFYRVLLQ